MKVPSKFEAQTTKALTFASTSKNNHKLIVQISKHIILCIAIFRIFVLCIILCILKMRHSMGTQYQCPPHKRRMRFS